MPVAYLMTWNPEKTPLDHPAEVSNWSTGRRKSGIAPGARLFFHKQGADPRGIVAAGWAESEIYEDDGHYVDFSTDRQVPAAEPLPAEVLKRYAIVKNWDRIQGSGIEITAEGAEILERLWAAHLSETSGETNLPEGEATKACEPTSDTDGEVEASAMNEAAEATAAAADFSAENAPAWQNARRQQSWFRSRVLKNFGSRCCLTGIEETNLLNASHIVPWRTRVDSRLDPANGLCLTPLYDRLFDRGYFTLSDDLTVITPEDSSAFGEPLRALMRDLEGRQATPPSIVPIRSEYLQYHRENVFGTWDSPRGDVDSGE